MLDRHEEAPARAPVDRAEQLDAVQAAAGTIVLADEATAELDIDRRATLPQLVRRIAAQRGSTDLAVPVFEQLVVARLLPRSAEIAEERREQLRAGRETARSAIAELLPDWSFPPRLDGGLAAWVNLGAPVSSQLALAELWPTVHRLARAEFDAYAGTVA